MKKGNIYEGVVKKVDFPTFGRPTTATIGLLILFLAFVILRFVERR